MASPPARGNRRSQQPETAGANAGDNGQAQTGSPPAPPDPPVWLDRVNTLRKERIAAIRALEAARGSTVFVFWNLDAIRERDFFPLAEILDVERPDKPIDLVVESPGGSGRAGYRIGHMFQRWANRNGREFRVIIPRYAMSAATILALGAHQLVMGLSSQIGPIDPQFRKIDQSGQEWYVPALTVFDGLKLVSEYVGKIPNTSRFFEQILDNQGLNLEELGMIERAREWGKQIGLELLRTGMLPAESLAETTVQRLSDFYKDHGHPIDAYEAEEVLGLNVLHAPAELWAVVSRLRDAYDQFVGPSDVIPELRCVSVVETATHRSWRHVSAAPGDSDRRVMAAVPLEASERVTPDG